ncbi:MAG: hypothetical protein V1821_04405, partial [bacterium]
MKFVKFYLLVAFLVLGAVGVYFFASKTSQNTTIVAPNEAATVFQPEIPIEQYWDFGKMGENKLFVNNTDRNVIYALNPSGKIAWQIWGKDYGFDRGYGGYEIRLIDNRLYITDRHTDATKNQWTYLWVFNSDGQLIWRQNFAGGLDMPQMHFLSDGKTIILENRSSGRECHQGCGVLCSQKPEMTCDESATVALDGDSGMIIWRNNASDYQGWALSVSPEDKITSRGGGWGYEELEYVLDGSTGVVESAKAVFGVTYKLPEGSVEFLENKKTKILAKDTALSEEMARVAFTATAQAELLPSGILVRVIRGERAGQMSMFSKEDGRLLWKNTLENIQKGTSQPFDIFQSGQAVIFEVRFPVFAKCDQYCAASSQCSGHICIDSDPSEDCARCNLGVMNAPNFVPEAILAVSVKDGSLLWKHAPGNYLSIKGVSNIAGEEALEVNRYESGGKSLAIYNLDLVSGKQMTIKTTEELYALILKGEWKTYQIDQLGLQFDYPTSLGDWKI